MVTCTGHIGIHEGADGRTDVRTYVVRTDVDDVMAIKPNFLTSMGYHIFLTMVLRARAELRYHISNFPSLRKNPHRKRQINQFNKRSRESVSTNLYYLIANAIRANPNALLISKQLNKSLISLSVVVTCDNIQED